MVDFNLPCVSGLWIGFLNVESFEKVKMHIFCWHIFRLIGFIERDLLWQTRNGLFIQDCSWNQKNQKRQILRNCLTFDEMLCAALENIELSRHILKCTLISLTIGTMFQLVFKRSYDPKYERNYSTWIKTRYPENTSMWNNTAGMTDLRSGWECEGRGHI